MDLKNALQNLNTAQAQAKLTQEERMACIQSLQALEVLVNKELSQDVKKVKTAHLQESE